MRRGARVGRIVEYRLIQQQRRDMLLLELVVSNSLSTNM